MKFTAFTAALVAVCEAAKVRLQAQTESGFMDLTLEDYTSYLGNLSEQDKEDAIRWFNQVDTDGDNVIQAEEYSNYLSAYL